MVSGLYGRTGEDSGGDGIPDVHLDLLSAQDLTELRGIYDHLSMVAGGGGRAEIFAKIMVKLGVPVDFTGARQTQTIADWGHEDVDADQMEDSLHAFHDAASKDAWTTKKDKGPRGIS